MKTFTTAAVLGLAAAETSFVDFITNMAIQEHEAKEIEAMEAEFSFEQSMETGFSFNELLTQMAIDEIEQS